MHLEVNLKSCWKYWNEWYFSIQLLSKYLKGILVTRSNLSFNNDITFWTATHKGKWQNIFVSLLSISHTTMVIISLRFRLKQYEVSLIIYNNRSTITWRFTETTHIRRCLLNSKSVIHQYFKPIANVVTRLDKKKFH